MTICAALPIKVFKFWRMCGQLIYLYESTEKQILCDAYNMYVSVKSQFWDIRHTQHTHDYATTTSNVHRKNQTPHCYDLAHLSSMTTPPRRRMAQSVTPAESTSDKGLQPEPWHGEKNHKNILYKSTTPSGVTVVGAKEQCFCSETHLCKNEAAKRNVTMSEPHTRIRTPPHR